MTTKEKLQKIIDKNETLKEKNICINDISRWILDGYSDGNKYGLSCYLYNEAASKRNLGVKTKYLLIKNLTKLQVMAFLNLREQLEQEADLQLDNDINSLL